MSHSRIFKPLTGQPHPLHPLKSLPLKGSADIPKVLGGINRDLAEKTGIERMDLPA